jgi:hypothetical protein
MSLSNLTIGSNTSSGGAGGGLFNLGDATLDMVTFDGNQAPGTSGAGGGIYNGSLGSIVGSGQITMTRSTLKNGRAALGGGLTNNDGLVTLQDVTVSDNAGSDVGGILNTARVSLERVTLSGNAGQVGALATADGGQAILVNVTISGNQAVPSPGNALGPAAGIHVAGGVDLANVTIAANTGVAGMDGSGGIRVTTGSQAILSNTIIANNTGGNCSGNLIGEFNLTFPAVGCQITGPSNLAGLDPALGPLSNNGGLTQTMALPDASPAIDTGTARNCPATDQRGEPRPRGRQCDIGAYESAFGPGQPTPSPTPFPTSVPTPVTIGGPPPQTTPPLLPCPPRPPVQIAVAPTGPGVLTVTVTAGRGVLREILFGFTANGTIAVEAGPNGRPGYTSSSGNARLILSDFPTSLTFTVGRTAAGLATTVPFTANDDCGPWPTFVGGGPNAF